MFILLEAFEGIEGNKKEGERETFFKKFPFLPIYVKSSYVMLGKSAFTRFSVLALEVDSRLGWEPSMEYMCDKERLEWKMREVDYVINYEIKNYRRSLTLKESDYRH